MNEQAKGHLIDLILYHLQEQVIRDNRELNANRKFDAGDLFFRLAFRTDDQLKQLAKEMGI